MRQIAAFSTTCRVCDHYRTLGVPRSASRAQIKSSFYRLSKELHPDANPDGANKEKWLAASEAYATLNDDRRRRAYDRDTAHSYATASARSRADHAQHPSYHGTYERPKHSARHAWERQGHQETRSTDFAHARARHADPAHPHAHSSSAGRPYYGRRHEEPVNPPRTDEDRLRDDNGLWRIGGVFIVTTIIFAFAGGGFNR